MVKCFFSIGFLFKKVNRILANTPYVNDIFKWNVKGKPKKGYQIIDGDKTYLLILC